MNADYVVVGGGTAGAVIASRLSENPDCRVLLLEAGAAQRSLMVRMPAGYARMIGDARYDWCYQQDADASIHGRRYTWSSGKMLGGSSSLNGQVYIRGSRNDFNAWAAAGVRNWSFEDCLPYYKKSESFGGAPAPDHGVGGPLHVNPARDPHPLSKVFLQACQETQIPTRHDYSNGDLNGAFMTLATQFPAGTRCSTDLGFLVKAQRRGNLEVLTDALAETLIFEGRRTVGVRAFRGTRLEEFRATREVIVCCGTIGSPALLMRSGVGPADQLRGHGIAVVHGNDAVGANLQEHVGVGVSRYVNVPTLNSQVKPHHMMRHLAKYFLQKKGPLVTPAVQAMAVTRTAPGEAVPDVQLHFLPLSFDVEDHSTSNSMAFMPAEPTVMINATTCNPRARGNVRLSSADPRTLPGIAHELLGDRTDVDTLIRAGRLIERIFEAPAWSKIVVRRRTPQHRLRDDVEWENYARSRSMIGYHMAGSCRMGEGAGSVVDCELRVHGLEGLRLADASIMPKITSGNTNATVIMIGERASDFVRGR